MSYQRIKSRNKWLIIAVIILSITLSLLAFGYVVNAFTLNSYATLLENNYQRSVYELATDLKNIEIDLSISHCKQYAVATAVVIYKD